MSLQSKLDQLKHDFEAKAPPAAVAALHRGVEELIATGAQDKALTVGDVAPLFVLRDSEGAFVSSSEFLARGPLIITFYRGVWCPYCNLDLAALEATRAELENRGAMLMAISPQTQANSRKSQRINKLGFPILCDTGGELAASFKLRWTVPDYLRVVHKQLGADLTAFNGDDSWTLPMPARYVIDRNSVIAYADVNADYTRRPEPSDMFPILDQLRQSDAA